MSWIETFLNQAFPYRAEHYTIQLPKVEEKEMPRAKLPNQFAKKEMHVTSESHQLFSVEKCDLSAQTEQTEWSNLAFENHAPKTLGAEIFLTEQDIEQMRARNLLTDAHIARAENIKPLWASGRSRAEIVAAFRRDDGKSQRGYSDGSIGKLLACFSASLEKAVQSCAK